MVVVAEVEHGVRETRQLLEREFPVVKRTENCPSAGGPQVEGDEVFGLHVGSIFRFSQKNTFFTVPAWESDG